MMKQFLENSYLFGGNAPFVEDLYEQYLADPAAVPAEWRSYFGKLQTMEGAAAKDVAHAPVGAAFAHRAKAGPRPGPPVTPLDPNAGSGHQRAPGNPLPAS